MPVCVTCSVFTDLIRAQFNVYLFVSETSIRIQPEASNMDGLLRVGLANGVFQLLSDGHAG